jgi:TPR repeat protein
LSHQKTFEARPIDFFGGLKTLHQTVETNIMNCLIHAQSATTEIITTNGLRTTMKRVLHQTVARARQAHYCQRMIASSDGIGSNTMVQSQQFGTDGKARYSTKMKVYHGRCAVSLLPRPADRQYQGQRLQQFSHQSYSSSVHASPSAITSSASDHSDNNNNTLSNIAKGEEWYQKAVEAMEQALEAEKERENKKSQQVQRAVQKAKDAERDASTQGVMVVKTIAKQARKEKRQTEEDDPVAIGKRRAVEYLERASYEFNHPIALVELGTMTLENANKTNITDDKRKELLLKAMELFRRAGHVGNSRVGWFNLGQLLWSGYPAATTTTSHGEGEPTTEIMLLEPNIDEALEAFTKAIELGDPDAMYLVGVSRMSYASDSSDGVGGGDARLRDRDPNIVATMHSSGFTLIEQAANLGHGGALYYLALLVLDEGSLYHHSSEANASTPSSREAAFVQRLDQAVEAGNADALFTRGHSYYHGSDGYPQSFQQALADFLQAAEVGNHADAAVSAGAMLHNGVGNIIPRDQPRAFQLYQQAGEWGSREGWQNVVACYVAGEGVPQSLETANYIAKTMLQKAILPEDS